jgi:hypothetical protein
MRSGRATGAAEVRPFAARWSLGDSGLRGLNRIAAELNGVADPIRLVRAGLYADIGEEIL